MGSVLIGGDLNGQFKQGALRETGNMKSKLLSDFIIRNNLLSLQSVYGRHNEYTFKTTQGVLDYFLVDGQCLNYVSMFDIEQPKNILTSDHIPIMCSLNLPTRKAEPVHKRDTVAWNICTPNDIEHREY